MKRFARFAVALFIAGCGGGGGGGGTSGTGGAQGKVSYQWAWPAIARNRASVRSRIIPSASNSVVLDLKDGSGTVVASGTIARPNASWTSPSVPVGTYTLTGDAFPGTNGSGVAQAAGSISVTVSADQTTNAELTLDSTAFAVILSAPNSSVNGGSQVQMTATVIDSSGNTIVVDPSAISWQSSDSTIATVNGSGLVTPLKLGTVGVTATFTEVDTASGQTPVSSSSFPLTVVGGSTGVTIH